MKTVDLSIYEHLRCQALLIIVEFQNFEDMKHQTNISALWNIVLFFKSIPDRKLENTASAWKANFQTETCYSHDMQNINNNVFQEAVAQNKATAWIIIIIKKNFAGSQKN